MYLYYQASFRAYRKLFYGKTLLTIFLIDLIDRMMFIHFIITMLEIFNHSAYSPIVYQKDSSLYRSVIKTIFLEFFPIKEENQNE